MENLRNKAYQTLRKSESFFKTDMVYLAKGGFWINGTIVSNSLFALVLSMAFSRLIDKETFGTYQFLLSVSSVLGALTLTGMNVAVTQAVARGFEGVFQRSVITQIKLGVIPFFVGLLVSAYYYFNGNSLISASLIVIAVLLPLTNALNSWTSFLNGKRNFESAFWYGQVLNAIYYSGLILCILFFPNTISLIFINFFLLMLANLIIYFLVVKKYKPDNKVEEEALSYGKKLSFSSAFSTVAMNIDNILIFHFLGAAHLAIYSFASNVPERFGSLLRPITTMALPKLAEKNQIEIARIIPKRTLQLFILALVGGVIYIACAPFLFNNLFPNYSQAIPYSQAYTLVVIFSIAGSLSLTSLYATRSDKIYYLNILYPVLNSIILLIGVYNFGIWGIVAGKALSSALLLASTLYLSKT